MTRNVAYCHFSLLYRSIVRTVQYSYFLHLPHEVSNTGNLPMSDECQQYTTRTSMDVEGVLVKYWAQHSSGQ